MIFSLFDAIILVLLMNTMNDYSKISAENTSSRMATISAEETYFIGDIVKDSKPHTDTLKWSHRELVDSKQFAYGDVDIYVVPVEGDIDKDKISWAVLVNGELGFKKTDKKNTVTVEEHFGLAD